MAEAKTTPAPSLDEIRTRIDAIDTELLRLIDERAGLSGAVAAAKAAENGPGHFGLRPGREAQIVRRLLALPRKSASAQLVVKVWREIMADNLAAQGPYHLAVWGGKDATRAVELARLRFGAAPPLVRAAKPEDALAAARTQGGVAVCALAPDSAWWGRLLAEPKLKVFTTLPCLPAWGEVAAFGVAAVEVDPTGDDMTFWVTDAPQSATVITDALSRDGVAAALVQETGGLKLFQLAGFYQPDDPRLARAPGALSGVIGAAPALLGV